MRGRSALVVALAAPLLALTAALPASAADEGSASDLLVQRWYSDFLDRPEDEGLEASGRGYWVDLLDDGEDQRRVLESVLSSGEFAQQTVDGYYRQHLGRGALDDPGAAGWVSGVRGDMEPEWVEQNVLASAEYAGLTGDERVDGWYRAVLGRTGDAPVTDGERAYWDGRIADVGALTALREVWYSAEAVEARIRTVYEVLLDRPRDQVAGGEIDYWYDRATDSRLGMAVDIAVAEEYAPVPPEPQPAPAPPAPVPPAPVPPAPADETEPAPAQDRNPPAPRPAPADEAEPAGADELGGGPDGDEPADDPVDPDAGDDDAPGGNQPGGTP